MTSDLVGQATFRISPRTSRRNWAIDARSSFGRGWRGAARVGAPSAVRAPWRCNNRLVSRFIDMEWAYCVLVGGGSWLWWRFSGAGQGRRDSNPRPPVLETGALPAELLPSEPRAR